MGLPDKEYFQIPDHCPICKSPTIVRGDFLYCNSDLCPSKLTGSIKVWIDRLGILHWGDAMIKSLTNPDLPSVSSIADLYRLSVEDLGRHCSGQKMAAKCWKTLHQNESIPFEVVLSALNIPNFGPSTATDVVGSGFDTVDKILSASPEDLEKVPNIGDITAKGIAEGLKWKASELRDLQSVLEMTIPSNGPLAGLKVCITGDVWAPRKSVQKMIIEAGGKAVGSVAKDTSLLVCNDVGTATSKVNKALKHGIPVISGDDLKSVLNGEKLVQDVVASH